MNEAYLKRSSISVPQSNITYQRRTSCSMGLELNSSLGMSRSLTTLHTVGKCKVEVTGHDRRRQHWLGRVLKMRWDVDKVRDRFKQAGSNIRGGVHALFRSRNRSSSKEEVGCEPHRSITVDYLKPGQTRNAYMGRFDDMDSSLDIPEKNFSSSLFLTQLQDGKFTSMIALDHLPVADVRILVCGYKLEIFLDSRRTKLDNKHKMCKPFKLGDIDIPIYVNPASMHFNIDEEQDTLCIVGMTKGYFARENLLGKGLPPRFFSVSSNDVQVLKDSMPSPAITQKKKKLKKVSGTSRQNSASSGSSSPVDSDNNQNLHCKAYRQRSNTQ